MAAIPALVLATLAALGGCPTGCPAQAPIDAPELPAPQPEPDVGLPNSPVDVPEGSVPGLGDLLQGADRYQQADMPGPSIPLEPTPTTLDQAELAQAHLGTQEPRAPDPGESEPAPVHSLDPSTRSGPSASGHAVHPADRPAEATGQAIDGTPARLAFSLLAGLAAVGLYHKLSKDRALEHPARQRILAMLEEQPGLGTTDVADRLDVCYRTARHHLEVLARFDLAVQAKHRGQVRWSRPEDADAIRDPGLPKTQRRLVELLDEDPGLHLSEIARRLDVAKATAKHHLDQLIERERVTDERVGPLRRFFPAGRRRSTASG